MSELKTQIDESLEKQTLEAIKYLNKFTPGTPEHTEGARAAIELHKEVLEMRKLENQEETERQRRLELIKQHEREAEQAEADRIVERNKFLMERASHALDVAVWVGMNVAGFHFETTGSLASKTFTSIRRLMPFGFGPFGK